MASMKRDEIVRAVSIARELKRRGLKPYTPTKLELLSWLKENDKRSDWSFSWHPLVMRSLQKVVDEGGRRIAISLPPRSGKSWLTSTRFPAYAVAKRPETQLMMISYSAFLSTKFSRRALNMVQRAGVPLGSKVAAAEWETFAEGGCFAAGIGGSITGRGFNIGIVDDLISSFEEAVSPRQLDKVWEGFSVDFMSRAEPNASVIMVMTRWSVDDPIGRLQEDHSVGWEFLNIPAISFGEGDPLGRPEGVVLNPKRQSLEQLNELRDVMSPRIFNALYQGTPLPLEGALIKADMIQRWPVGKEVPELDEIVCYWDTSGGKATAATAGVTIARAKKDYFILNVTVGRWSAEERMRKMISATDAVFAMWPSKGRKQAWVEVQGGSAGVEVADWERKRFRDAGLRLEVDKPTGSKEERAIPFASMVESGKVWALQGPWLGAYLNELASFPHGRTKDQADASSGAFSKLFRRVSSAIY